MTTSKMGKTIKKAKTYISKNPTRESIFMVDGQPDNLIKGGSMPEVLRKYKYGRGSLQKNS